MAELRICRTSKEQDCRAVEELILDYACKNYMHMDDVITAIASHRGHATFAKLNVPHLRIIMVTIYSIVQREDIMNFEGALHLLGVVHGVVPDVLTNKQYVKLATGLKTKVLLNKLSQRKFDYADVCSTLNQYFPKSELKSSGVSQEDSVLNTYQLRYRRLITRLMLSVSEREAYLRNEMDAELGRVYMSSIQRLLRLYIDRVNKRLNVPVIEQIAAEGPQSQICHDIQDSQSDCMDQLLSACFHGPPSQDVLISILKAAWEEEEEEGEEEEKKGEETICEEMMAISDGTCMEDDGDYLSATDIFDFPEPSTSFKIIAASIPTKHANPQGSSSLPQNPRTKSSHAKPSNGYPEDIPVQEAMKDVDTVSKSVNNSADDCANNPSGTSNKDIGCPDDKPVQARTESSKSEEAAFYPSLNSAGDYPNQRPGQEESLNSQPLYSHSLDSAGEVTGVTCSVESVNTSEREATRPKQVHQQRSEVLDHQEQTAPAPSECKLPPKTGTNQTLPDSPVSQQTDPKQFMLSQEKHPKPKESVSFTRQVPSTYPAPPRRSSPTVDTIQKKRSTLIVSSCPTTVSKSRIYLSKNHPQIRTTLKRTRFTTEKKSCIELTQSKSYNPSLHELVKRYKTCVDSEESNPETSSSQISSGSDSSQSLSDESSTSVSLLCGMMGLKHAPKHPRSWSPVMTLMEEGDEMMGLTFSYPFEDIVFSELEVYPVTRLIPCGTKDDSGGQTERNSNNELQMEVIPDTPMSTPAASGDAPHVADQDNTVSSSNRSSGSGSQSQKAEVRVDEEVKGHEPSPEMPEMDWEVPSSVDVESKCATVQEPEALKGGTSSLSCPQDVEESPPCQKKPTKKKPTKKPVNLKRLSQDNKVRKYLETSTASTSSHGNMSVDETSQSSDSEDSIVPDSDDDESGWTSDSSSLPCIELRPDSEHSLIRRFPSLKQYLRESEEDTSEKCRMRECTVRLRRLEPGEIDALTKGRSIFNR